MIGEEQDFNGGNMLLSQIDDCLIEAMSEILLISDMINHLEDLFVASEMLMFESFYFESLDV